MPNGCYNREPFQKEFIAQDGYTTQLGDIKAPTFTKVEFRMSEHCNYTHTQLGQADKNCRGCIWRHNSEATPSH